MRQSPHNIYHVYVPSFCEQQPANTPHRGTGNLAGITSKVPYIAELGASVVWLSPFFASPRLDGGYDISDHRRIDPQFGTDQDFDGLADALHRRDIELMIDIVPNHTSSEHPWFIASADPDHPQHLEFRSHYIWQEPAPGSTPGSPLPPNNWASVFSKSQVAHRLAGRLAIPPGEHTPALSAWHFNPKRQQFYLASFSPHQPDLNLHSGRVRHEVRSIAEYWRERGVRFFRWDAVPYVGKDANFRNESKNPAYHEDSHGRPLPPYDNPYDQLIRHYSSGFWPALPMVLNDLLIGGETAHILEAYLPQADLALLDTTLPANASMFNFTGLDAPWQGRARNDLLASYHAGVPANKTPNHVQGNHDKPYVASRFGQRAARASAVVQLTLPGDCYIYNGEEGGFVDDRVPPNRIQDPLGGRDGCRTPMLWDSTASAGFSEASPEQCWLPVSTHAEVLNLADQASDPHSMLAMYRALLTMRRQSRVLQDGSFVPLASTASQEVISFARRTPDTQLLTVANTLPRPVMLRLQGTQQYTGRVLLSSRGRHGNQGARVDLENLTLQADEALVIVPGS